MTKQNAKKGEAKRRSRATGLYRRVIDGREYTREVTISQLAESERVVDKEIEFKKNRYVVVAIYGKNVWLRLLGPAK